ncbi:MAG: DUF3877 family protein [Ruminococcus sp.]|nr:DUF3877 family protein [Ruminococcus sp.]
MDYTRLEKNITDNIREAHAKLGFEKRAVSLNYMLGSLNSLLDTDFNSCDMKNALADFSDSVSERLRKLSFREIKGGFCITVSAEGTEYIHNSNGSGFIEELVETVRSHGRTYEDVIRIFRKYSDSVKVVEKHNDEFDYLVFFEDGVPDEYLYCISLEEEIDGSTHITYHRFIREDYEAFGF